MKFEIQLLLCCFIFLLFLNFNIVNSLRKEKLQTVNNKIEMNNEMNNELNNEMNTNTFSFKKFHFDTSNLNKFYRKKYGMYAHNTRARRNRNNDTAATSNSTEPTKNTLEPTKNTTEPTKNTLEPTKNTTEPTKNTTEPTKNTTEPTKNTTEPTKNTTEPTKNTTEPTKNTTEPTKNTTPPTTPSSTAQHLPLSNPSNSLHNLRSSLYRNLNTTFYVKDGNEFRQSNRKWDLKILDKQLEEVFATLLYKQQDRMTTNGVRNYMEIFLNKYQACDQDMDNVLNLAEFTQCMTTDPYFIQLIPTPVGYASNQNYASPAVFYTTIFNVLDERNEKYINFIGYMKMRLFAYSWRECSTMAPYIEEASFECALEIAAGHKTATRTLARNIYKIALDLANNPTLRNIDFITYMIIANTVRLYGKINSKEDNDITRNEFNLALDDNLLPFRYNQEIINQLFHLVDDYDRPDQGIDLESFIYYDFVLQLFYFHGKARPYYMTYDEFNNVLNDPLFPNKTINEIYYIPQYVITPSSYQMYQYINISQYITEGDYLYKFLEIKSEVELEKSNKNQQINPLNNGTNVYKMKFDFNYTTKLIFDLYDHNQDGYINFADFGNFMQITFTYAKADEYSKGKLTAGRLYELYKNYADLPMISYRLREKSERFNLFEQNTYIDLLSSMQILKIEDIAKYYMRKTDTSIMFEYDVKKILNRVNMRYIPETYLNRCLRGVDVRTVPRYDWECSFKEGMNLNLQYFDNMDNYKDVKNNNLDMMNTVFYNVDPNYFE